MSVPNAEPGTIPFGPARVYADYQNLPDVLAGPNQKAYFNRIWAAASGDKTVDSWPQIATLDADARTWLGYALYLYGKNKSRLPEAFDHRAALDRLITWAPRRNAMPGEDRYKFEREVLAVSGWTEAAVPAALKPPQPDTLTKLATIYNAEAEPGQEAADMTYITSAVATSQPEPTVTDLEGAPRVTVQVRPDVLLAQPTALIADEPSPGSGGDGRAGHGEAGSSATGAILTGKLYHAVRDDLLPKLADVLAGEASYWSEPDGRDLTPDPIDRLAEIANLIQRYLALLFQPYADGWPSGPGNNGFRYSDVLKSTQTILASPEKQLDYLCNRAVLVGWDPRYGQPLAKAGYDSRRNDDEETLRAVLQDGLTTNQQLRSDVICLIKFTPRHSAGDGNVYIQPAFPSSRWDGTPAKQAKWRWRTIRTLAHELLHKLAHPDYVAAARQVRNAQTIAEGFVDLLTVDLFTALREALKRQGSQQALGMLFEGIGDPGEPEEMLLGIRYGKAGEAAGQVRDLVADDNVRAAFFLGAVDLIGVRPAS